MVNEGDNIPQITLNELKAEKRKKLKSRKRRLIFIIFTIFTICLIITDQIGKVPVLILVLGVDFLWEKGYLKKIMGEVNRPKRSKFNLQLTWFIVILLFCPLAIISMINIDSILTNLNNNNFNWESLLVLTPGPALLTLVRSLILRKDSETNKRLLSSITKKIVLSSLCLILFFPFIFVVNKLGIDPALKPDFTELINVGIGLYFWLTALFFYSGIFLILISIGDLFDLLERGK